MAPDKLDAAIRSALTEEVTSGQAQATLERVEKAIARSREEHAAETAKALDFRSPAPASAAAKGRADALEFETKRLTAAAAQLGDRIKELQANERREANRALADRIEAERDALVIELQEAWPKIVEFVDLLKRMHANDQAIISAGLTGPLAFSEAVARGFSGSGNWPDAKGAGPVLRLTRLPIPNFDRQGLLYDGRATLVYPTGLY